MAIGIHHGPSGSYKSSGVVDDYLLPAMLEGRHVVTNLRGVTRENCFDIVPETHPEFDVTYIDTSKKAGREKILIFWHWVPHGALLLFDEARTIFPMRLRDSDLKKLDLHDYESKDRPMSFAEAFDEHRHYNWDIVVMAVSIKAVRSEIREPADAAYKHKNRALLGAFFKGKYNLGVHDPDVNGTNPSQFQSVNKREIKDARVFKLYKSTKTGKHQDTNNGNSIFKNGRLMVSMVIASCSLGYAAYSFAYNDVFSENPSGNTIESVAPAKVVPVSSPLEVRSVSINSLGSVQVNQSFSVEPFYGHQFIIQASLSAESRYLYFFTASKAGSSFPITSIQLEEAGYSVIRVTDCAATIVFKQNRQNVNCGSLGKKTKALGVGA
jgi:zona occludens toxin